MKKAAIATAILILIIELAFLGFFFTSNREYIKESFPAVSMDELQATPEPTPQPTPETTPESKPEPTPEPTPEPEPEYFVISMVGDCTPASSQHHKGTAYAFETIIGTDYALPFAKTKEYFENDYLSIANLESTFTQSTESNGATFVFKSDAEYAQVFSQGSIEMVVLGNNHVQDFGSEGAEDTKAALDAAGVYYAADDDWYIYQRDDGLKVGVYSKLYPTVENVTTGIAELKDAGAELIVAALHWGIEGSYQVTSDQTAVGHAAVDAGALIVYGCHPHVLQRTEEYNGALILYSLGNWSFGGNTNPRDRDTAIAQVTVIRDIDGSISISEANYIPCELSSAQGYNDYQPHVYEKNSEGYDRVISKLDGSFSGPDLSIDYSAFHTDVENSAKTDNIDTSQSQS